MSDDELEAIYTWVDEVPLKRPKKNIQRDFADGSLLAHIIQHYLPKNQKALIQVHNYPETMKREAKKNNWEQLNRKVLKNFCKLQLTAQDITNVIDCQQGAIEKILKKVKDAMEAWKKKKPQNPASNQKKYIEDKLAQKRHMPDNVSALEFTNP